MSEEVKAPEVPASTEEAQKIEAETKELTTASNAGVKGIVLYAMAHPKSVIAIVLSLALLALVIGITFSGYEKTPDGAVRKSPIEVPRR